MTTGPGGTLDAASLRGPVRKLTGDPTTEPLGWRVEPLHGGTSPSSLGRVAGRASVAGGETPFSLVLKQARPAQEDERSWRYWRREPLLYASGWLDDLPGVRAPRCYGVDETEDGARVWLEEVSGSAGWTIERYARAARDLGLLTARTWSVGRWPISPGSAAEGCAPGVRRASGGWRRWPRSARTPARALLALGDRRRDAAAGRRARAIRTRSIGCHRRFASSTRSGRTWSIPAVETFSATANASALNNVLLDTFDNTQSTGPGPVLCSTLPASQRTGSGCAATDVAAEEAQGALTPQAAAKLVSGLAGIGGTVVYPFYPLPQAAEPNFQGQYLGVVSCQVMRDLAVLGQCAPGLQAVQVQDQDLLYSDNPHNSTAAFVDASNPAYTGNLAALPLQAVLVRVNNAAALERVRTYLAVHAPPQVSAGPGAAATPPRTYGEAVAIRSGRAHVLQRLVSLAVALTILVAGCSLAVAIGGGLADRKRPFTLLRVGGTPVGTLYRVLLMEAAVPLAAATLLAAALAYGMSVLTVWRLAPPGMAIPLLGPVYYATMGIGLAMALIVIGVTLPLLNRMTGPDNARFE